MRNARRSFPCFPDTHPRFPVRPGREFHQNREYEPEVTRRLTASRSGTSEISLYFRVISGNATSKLQRPTSNGLPPPPSIFPTILDQGRAVIRLIARSKAHTSRSANPPRTPCRDLDMSRVLARACSYDTCAVTQSEATPPSAFPRHAGSFPRLQVGEKSTTSAAIGGRRESRRRTPARGRRLSPAELSVFTRPSMGPRWRPHASKDATVSRAWFWHDGCLLDRSSAIGKARPRSPAGQETIQDELRG